jgi:L-serine dehydratase
MESLTELYRIGNGPSSSHSLGPRAAMVAFCARHPDAAAVEVVLYGSLAATGRGHGTDRALEAGAAGRPVRIRWRPEVSLPAHPNGMRFIARDAADHEIGAWTAYSVGGGAIRGEGESLGPRTSVYDRSTFTGILAWCRTTGRRIPDWVEEREGAGIWDFLAGIRTAMDAAIDRGLAASGELPGGLGVRRRAASHLAGEGKVPLWRRTTLAVYALAVSEENAAGGVVVTAPTCGGAGVLPAVLRHLAEQHRCDDRAVLRALATAGVVGNLVKTNASISGAAIGCQGEVGTACAMAAAAAAELLGGSPEQVECAAEIGIEHHLGMTCDPVAGLVQIPCIERNAVGALRAVDAAALAMLGDGAHRVSFDQAVEAMRRTGADLGEGYRETSRAGLAAIVGKPPEPGNACG